MFEKQLDLVVIGGGPAGLAAALSAKKSGLERILILEREHMLGGILNQCIHNGFGLHTFQEELTGPEYAARYVRKIQEEQIPFMTETMVTDLSRVKEGKGITLTVLSRMEGMGQISTKAVILAMGCRERPRGALNIPGYRPAGIYSAGTAQYYVNMEGRMPGREIVILGSGDIGLIMARRLTLEGAKVKVVAELMPYSGGLKRNIVQCLDDFQIPLKLSHTVTEIRGRKRVEGVTLSRVDEHRRPIPGTEEEYSCDTLLLSCGLIPENELSRQLGIRMNPVTSGPEVDESLETSIEGVFACGNVLHVHDLVDYVSEEAEKAGRHAADYVLGHAAEKQKEIRIKSGNGVRYTVPSAVSIDRMEDRLMIRFRVGDVYRDKNIAVYSGDRLFMKVQKRILAPGEMEQVELKKEKLLEMGAFHTITVQVEEREGGNQI